MRKLQRKTPPHYTPMLKLSSPQRSVWSDDDKEFNEIMAATDTFGAHMVLALLKATQKIYEEQEMNRRIEDGEWQSDHVFTNRGPFQMSHTEVIRNLLGDSYTFAARMSAIRWLRWRDESISEFGGVYAVHSVAQPEEDMYNNRILRIEIDEENGGHTSVVTFGLSLDGDVLDSELEGDYLNPQALPEWVQERLAILMLTPSDAPTEEVAGIGRRMSENIFWVYVK